MSRLSTEKIAAEVESKGFSLVDDSNYKNISSFIKVKCSHGHIFETTLDNVRRVSFECPLCVNTNFHNPNIPPQKKGFRLISFDQATEHFGLAIYDDDQLSFYSLYTFTGELKVRLVKIAQFLKKFVIEQCKPDVVVMEDIQMQRSNAGTLTFKVLAMLYGIIQEILCENGIEVISVAPNI